MSRVADLLFPPVCAGCGELTKIENFFGGKPDALCADCRRAWDEAKKEICGICRRPVATCNCLTEEMERARFSAFCKLVYYVPKNRDHVQNRAIYRIKDHADSTITDFLARELCEPIRAALRERKTAAGTPDARGDVFLVYLPRSRRAVLEKGTDQARELAKALSEQLGLPLLPVIARRFGHGKAQKTLSPVERRRNANAAFRFRACADVKGKCALVVDDIVTGGASMSAAAKLLRRAGVRELIAVAVASDESNRMPPVGQPTLRTEFDRLGRTH